METMDRLNQFIAEHGYVVIASAHRRKIGYIFQRWNSSADMMRHPMLVIAETDSAEFMEQLKVVYGGGMPYKHRFYYRCVTD